MSHWQGKSLFFSPMVHAYAILFYLQICVWDTVNDHEWRVDIRSHRVQDVIENILKKPDEFDMPKCEPEGEDCQDCGLWNFFDDRDQLFPSFSPFFSCSRM